MTITLWRWGVRIDTARHELGIFPIVCGGRGWKIGARRRNA